MKETTKMSRAVGQLEKIYNTLNADLFNGELPIPIITVQSKPGSYGHCTTSKVWRNRDTEQYEMNIAAEMLNMEIEEVLEEELGEESEITGSDLMETSWEGHRSGKNPKL